MWDKPKIAIIGMGFLMSYLKPCYHHVIGDDLSKNIVASTATASTTEKKSKAMGFPVQCGDYFNMLVNFEFNFLLASTICRKSYGKRNSYALLLKSERRR